MNSCLPPHVCIERAQSSDRAALEQIATHPDVAPHLVHTCNRAFWATCPLPPWSKAICPTFVLRNRSHEQDPSIYGYCTLMYVENVGGDGWASFELAISPEHWGKGLGRRVMKELPRLVWEVYETRGIRFAVFEDNVRARALYEALGFVVLKSFWWWTSDTQKRRAWEMCNLYAQPKPRNKIGF